MCAAVYAMQVEQIQSERQVAAALGLDLPTVADFDLEIGMVEHG